MMADWQDREERKRKIDQEEAAFIEIDKRQKERDQKSSTRILDSKRVETKNGSLCEETLQTVASSDKGKLEQSKDCTTTTTDEDYFRCYADIKIHEEMLSDKVRTLAYRHALLENRSKLKGATVLDVGAGTGILSHFAIQAGASKVFAVEPTRIAHFARQICKENGIEDSVSVIQSKIEDASIPIKVDSIVSEWMGYSLLYESMLPSVLWARDRFLKPGGEMYPCQASLFLAPINDEAVQERLDKWKQMKDLYGVSMTSLEPLTKDALTARADSLPLDIESVLANACQLCSFDLKTMAVQDAQDVQADFEFWCYGHSTLHGFATWFTVTFPGGSSIDTSPYALQTHWGQTVLYLREPVAVQQDTTIRGAYRMRPSRENPRFWDISVDYQVNQAQRVTQRWRCAD